MNNLFNAFLPITLWASAIILTMLIVRKLLSHKLSAWVFKTVWICLAIRLILPFDLAVKNAPITVPVPNEIYIEAPKAQSPDILNTDTNQGSFTSNTTLPDISAPSFKFSLKASLPFLWLLGAAVFFSAEIISYFIFVIRLRKTRTSFDGLNASANYKIKVYISSHVSSPALCGFVWPAIYLPQKSYTKQERENILQHEMTHYKHGDLWVQLLLLCAASLSWFNPLVHIMRRKAICDIEMTVDEKMLKNADMQQRIIYGQMLFAEISSREGLLMAQYNSGKGTKERFKAILNTATKGRGRALLCAIIALCTGISLMVSCAPKTASSEDNSLAITAPSAIDNPIDSSSSQPASSSTDDVLKLTLPLAQYSDLSRIHLTEKNNIEFDIPAPKDTPVLAVMDGTVAQAVSDGSDKGNWSLGNYVKIDHGGGVYTIYAHCTEVKAEKGSTVKAGDVIATVGTTGRSNGNHLGFSIETDDNEKFFAKILELTPEDICNYLKENIYKKELTEEEIRHWTFILEGAQNIVK